MRKTGYFFAVILSFIPLSCSDLYNELIDNVQNKYHLSIVEYTATNARLLDVNSDGSFTPADWSDSGNISKVFFSDINRDGDTDIVTIKNPGFPHGISYSDGKGNFTNYITLSVSSSAVSDACAADFNGDGLLDICTVHSSAPYGWYYLNNGSSGFSGPLTIPVTGSTLSVASADFDGDGDNDIFAGTVAGGNNELWLNDLNQSGTFIQRTDWTTAQHNYETHDVVAADFDGDGDMDIMEVGGSFAYYNRVWRNNGSGYFTLAWNHSINVTGVILVADYDLDGDLDAFTNWNPSYRYLLINNGNAEFTIITDHGINQDAVSAVTGDIDTDGDYDIIISTASNLVVYKNDGSGRFYMANSSPSLGSSKISIGAVNY